MKLFAMNNTGKTCWQSRQRRGVISFNWPNIIMSFNWPDIICASCLCPSCMATTYKLNYMENKVLNRITQNSASYFLYPNTLLYSSLEITKQQKVGIATSYGFGRSTWWISSF